MCYLTNIVVPAFLGILQRWEGWAVPVGLSVQEEPKLAKHSVGMNV